MGSLSLFLIFISMTTFQMACNAAPNEVAQQTPTEMDITAKADVDIYMIEEHGEITPIIISETSATADVMKSSRRTKMYADATATVDIFELENILLKTPGDIENLKKTWYLYKSTKAPQPPIESDVVVCTNRYTLDSCSAVKWQYSVGDDGQLISKLWGFDKTNFIYVQENINWLTTDYHILKSVVTNVMKATVHKLVAESCVDKFDLVEYLDEIAYVILAAEWDSFVIFQTVDNMDSVTYVALPENVYMKEDKSALNEKIWQALLAHKIDGTSMNTFTKTFNVQTNSIKPQKKDPKSKPAVAAPV